MHKQNEPMQQRIDHLEGLVKKLLAERQDLSANNTSHSQGGQVGTEINPVATDASNAARGPSTTVIDGISAYEGAYDWHDVLEEVCSPY